MRCLSPLAVSVFILVVSQVSRGAEDQAPPPYQVRIERNVPVPMRDGVTLRADLYLPVREGRAAEERLPAVLQRTPYDKEWSTNTLVNCCRTDLQSVRFFPDGLQIRPTVFDQLIS